MKNWIPQDIKNLRMKYKLSQPVFGEMVGVSGNYIYLLEKGVKKPSKTLRILFGYIEKEIENGEGKYGKRAL